MERKLVLIIACVLTTLWSFGQDIKMHGSIVDSKMQPLPGVSVQIKGTGKGANTDTEGKFEIQAKREDLKGTLVCSFVGYKTLEVSIDNKTIFVLKMDEVSIDLDEIVAVGYGSVKKRDLTGSVASVRQSDINKSAPISINQGLQGRIAGVVVQQSDGSPGGGINIQIRGSNSFGSSTEPLYVIDGIPFGNASVPKSSSSEGVQSVNPLSNINPQDIESVEILKDASATAIYGSRGANGVVLITTKKGSKDGLDNIEVNTSIGIASITKKIDMLDSYLYTKMRNEADKNKYYYEGGTLNMSYPDKGWWSKTGNDSTYYPSPDDYRTGKVSGGPDWQNEIFRTAITKDYTINFNGSGEKGSYNVSANYLDQDGIILNSGYKRYNTSANIYRKPKTWLEFGTYTNFSNSTTNLAPTGTGYQKEDMGIIFNALAFPPTMLKDESKSMDQISMANPLSYVKDISNEIVGMNFFSASWLQFRVLNMFTIKQNFGYNYSYNQRDIYFPRTTYQGKEPETNGAATRSDSWYKGTTSETILNFYRTFAKIHNISAMAAYTYERSDYGWKYISAKSFATDNLSYYSIGDATLPLEGASGRGMSSLMSYLGRVNYSLMDKYLFTASFRRDGSSKFNKNNRWSNFSSGALAWKASEETFIKNLNIFNTLKLRVSYGETGNQAIGAYGTSASLAYTPTVINGVIAPGFADNASKGPANPGLRWETTQQYNAGIDIGVFNDRINLTIDAYQKETKDLLQKVLTAPSTGFSSQQVNRSMVSNKGIELSLNAVVLTTPVRWTFNGNISFNKNEISGLDADQFSQRLIYGMEDIFVQRNGQPIGAIFGFKEDGFYDNEAEVRADPKFADKGDVYIKSIIGTRKFMDLDGDPKTLSSKDKTIIGNTTPDYTFGITNNFEYKNFNLSVFFMGSIGNDIINTYYANMMMGNYYNIPVDVYNNRWIPEDVANGLLNIMPGTNPKWGKVNASYATSKYFSESSIEDGSYIRLKNINFGYTFKNLMRQIKSVNLYCSMSNVYTWTNYSWYDPDVNAFGGDASRRGVDLNSYPNSRTITLGIKCVF